MRLYVLAGLAVALLAAVLGAWLVFTPHWAVGAIQNSAETSLHRQLKVNGGAHIEFSPLAIRLDDISLANPDGMEGELLTAKALRVKTGLRNLVSRQLGGSRLILVEPHIALTIDGIGRPNWPREVVSDYPVAVVALEQATVSFADQRSEQRFQISDGDLIAAIAGDGEVSLSGSAKFGGRPARFEADIEELKRLSEDGSPGTLWFDSAPLKAEFDGRITTREALSLAGVVSLSGPDLREALNWSGAGISGRLARKEFRLEGAIDSKARAFAAHKAQLQIGDLQANGDLSIDFRNRVPAIRAALTSKKVNLGRFVPDTGWARGDWGKTSLGLSGLRGIEAAVSLEAQDFFYGAFHTGPAKLAATVKAGRFDAQLQSPGVLAAGLTLDGSSSIPAFALAMEASSNNITALLASLAGIAWLSGKGRFSISVAATGNTQQELVSALKGKVQVAMRDGAIRGIDISKMFSTSPELNGWPGGEKAATAFSSLATDIGIADGIASAKTFRLESPIASIAGVGEVDLLRQAIDFRIQAPSAVEVKGPWRSPKISVSSTGKGDLQRKGAEAGAGGN